MLKFTPKKFIDALELRGFKITQLVQRGVQRSVFIPRYEPFHSKDDLTIWYQKGIKTQSIDKIATALIDLGVIEEDERDQLYHCFKIDNYDFLLPEDLL